jgi:hypothetical protein
MHVTRQFHGGKGTLDGYGQAMADGTWAAAGVATIRDDAQGRTEVHRVAQGGPFFATEEEAAHAGLEKLVDWAEADYPSS